VAVGHPEESDNKPRLLEDPLGPYSVSKYPITRRLYSLFDRNHQVHYEDDYKLFSRETRCPVIKANWFDAKMFSIWSKGRLLTEWEWEYACRGNYDAEAHRKLTHWQSDPKNDTDRAKVAWILGNSQKRTWPVDVKQDESHTNAFGLVDMLGNVWEWTESIHEAGGVSRVLRGGSFHDFGRGASASYRNHFVPAYTSVFNGFRVARAREGKS
jgi:formylglycine-generating enzyme required for sulfatase activity